MTSSSRLVCNFLEACGFFVILVSHSFGYGLMDAWAMVQMAREWTSVPEQHKCEIRSYDRSK